MDLGRETKSEIVLVARLRGALQKLNPEVPREAIEQAIEELLRDRSRMSLVAANRDVYKLLKQEIRIQIIDPDDGGEQVADSKLAISNIPEAPPNSSINS